MKRKYLLQDFPCAELPKEMTSSLSTHQKKKSKREIITRKQPTQGIPAFTNDSNRNQPLTVNNNTRKPIVLSDEDDDAHKQSDDDGASDSDVPSSNSKASLKGSSVGSLEVPMASLKSSETTAMDDNDNDQPSDHSSLPETSHNDDSLGHADENLRDFQQLICLDPLTYVLTNDDVNFEEDGTYINIPRESHQMFAKDVSMYDKVVDNWFERLNMVYTESKCDMLKTSIRILLLRDAEGSFDKVIDGLYDLETVNRSFKQVMSGVHKVYLLGKKIGILNHQTQETHDRLAKMQLLMEVIWNAYLTVWSSVRLKHITQAAVKGDLSTVIHQPQFCQALMFSPVTEEGNGKADEDVIKVYNFLMMQALRHNYRKYKGKIYRSKRVFCKNKKYDTHAWEYVSTMEGFIKKFVTKDTHLKLWKYLHRNHRNTRNLAEDIASGEDPELPELVPDRHVFAFRNGIYDCRADVFHMYETDEIDSKLTACKYFDAHINIEHLWEVAQRQGNWRDIKTPTFQKILDDQRLNRSSAEDEKKVLGETVADVVYWYLGRLLYDIGERENWEVTLFIRGKAGTGKSTICRVAKNFYELDDVGLLTSNFEKQFGLQALLGKLIILGTEVKTREWKLAQADFQSILSGEEISVAIKHQISQTVMLKAHTLFTGNEDFPYDDIAGCLERRKIPIEFTQKIKETDPDMWKELQKEMPLLIAKCNLAYLDKVNLVSKAVKKGIWSNLPPYFEMMKKKCAVESNPLKGFIESDWMRVDLSPGVAIPWSVFQKKYSEYCETNNVRKAQLKEADYGSVFEEYGIVKKTHSGNYGGKVENNKQWIFGLEVNDSVNLGNANGQSVSSNFMFPPSDHSNANSSANFNSNSNITRRRNS